MTVSCDGLTTPFDCLIDILTIKLPIAGDAVISFSSISLNVTQVIDSPDITSLSGKYLMKLVSHD